VFYHAYFPEPSYQLLGFFALESSLIPTQNNILNVTYYLSLHSLSCEISYSREIVLDDCRKGQVLHTDPKKIKKAYLCHMQKIGHIIRTFIYAVH
jgi:hypothetical protein